MEELIAMLREQRIKHGVDYSIVAKHNYIVVTCHEVWREAIQIAASQCGYRVTRWFTFNE